MELELQLEKLSKILKAEFQTSKVLISSVEQTLNEIETKKISATKQISYDLCEKITVAFENLLFDLYKFNLQLSYHDNYFNLSKINIAYLPADLSQYIENHQSTCIIVNASNDSDEIHIYDINNTEKYNNFFSLLYTNYENNSYECSKVIPSVNKVFGIFQNNCFYRAVRNSGIEGDHFFALLIDHGNVIRLSIFNNFYSLTPEIQNEPSLAIACKVIDVHNEAMNEFLDNCLHQKYSFVVRKNHHYLIEISLKSLQNNPFITTELCENEKKWFNFACVEKDNKNLNIVECNEKRKFLKSLNGGRIFKSISNRSNIQNTSKDYLFSSCPSTSSDHDFDYSEDLFKLKCNKETVENEKDIKEEPPLRFLKNLSADSQQIRYSKVIKKSPAIGENIFVLPIHMLNVSVFYGQIINDESSLVSLSQLQLKLNDRVQVSKYTKFTLENLPKKNDLVLARFTDGLFYRAQIIQENFDEFKVFYLDYGNDLDLHYSELLMWEKQYEYLPFQAAKFQLANIKTKIHVENNEDKATEAEQFLTRNFLNKKFLAKVISKKADVSIVTISSPSFKCPTNDLSDLLVIKNFAIYHKA